MEWGGKSSRVPMATLRMPWFGLFGLFTFLILYQIIHRNP